MSDITNQERIHRHSEFLQDLVTSQYDLKPIERLLLDVHLGFLDILIHTGEESFILDKTNIHRILRSLPHRDFFSKLPFPTLLDLFEANKAAMYIDFELCGLSSSDLHNGFFHKFSTRLVNPVERSTSIVDLSFAVWNILAIRRYFLLTIINCVKITNKQTPIHMSDPLCDFEEVQSCAVSAFNFFSENKILCEQAVYPRLSPRKIFHLPLKN